MASLCALITGRQRELYSRFTELQQAIQEDGGTVVDDVQLAGLIDELDVWTEVGKCWLSELQERAADSVAA